MDGVDCGTRCDRKLIRGAELTRQVADLRVVSRHAEKGRIKIFHVLPELAGGIAIWIYRDKDELEIFGAGRILGDVVTHAGQHRQRRRTDVRAMSEAEKEKRPFTLQACMIKYPILVIGEREGGKRLRVRKQFDHLIRQ